MISTAILPPKINQAMAEQLLRDYVAAKPNARTEKETQLQNTLYELQQLFAPTAIGLEALRSERDIAKEAATVKTIIDTPAKFKLDNVTWPDEVLEVVKSAVAWRSDDRSSVTKEFRHGLEYLLFTWAQQPETMAYFADTSILVSELQKKIVAGKKNSDGAGEMFGTYNDSSFRYQRVFSKSTIGEAAAKNVMLDALQNPLLLNFLQNQSATISPTVVPLATLEDTFPMAWQGAFNAYVLLARASAAGVFAPRTQPLLGQPVLGRLKSSHNAAPVL